MEMSGQGYDQVINMPVKRFIDYIKWKTKVEEEKNSKIKEEMDQNKLRI
jgi:hypothetical protein